MSEFKLFSSPHSSKLGDKIAAKLKTPHYVLKTSEFSDGESRIEVDTNVRGVDVYLVHSTHAPVNTNMMNLILSIDAFKRASAASVNVVIPYFGYARQDRRPSQTRSPVSARVMADMIKMAGADHVITIDLHSSQIEGFFSVPIDNLSAGLYLAADMYTRYCDQSPIIVSPDAGGVLRARNIAKSAEVGYEWELAIVDKRRPSPNVAEVMNVIGNIENRLCIIVDDMIDTAGTLCKASDALMARGAAGVVAYTTHGVLSGNAYENIQRSSLEQVYITDTISTTAHSSKITTISIANLLAEAIHRNRTGQSLTAVFS